MKTDFTPENLNRLSKYSGRIFNFSFGGVLFTHVLGCIQYMTEIEEFVFIDSVRIKFSNGEAETETRISSASSVEQFVKSGKWKEVVM